MKSTENGLALKKVIDKCYVYFFPERDKRENAIKIGYSKHPLKRLKQLQTGHPTKIGSEGWYEFESEKHAAEFEANLHKLFKKDRIRSNGEWFIYSDEIRRYIEVAIRSKGFTRYFY